IDNNVLPGIYLLVMEQTHPKILGFRLLLAAWLMVACPAGASTAADVINIRLGVHPDHTRVVLDLSASAKYRIEPQTDPQRVVITLEDAGFRLTSGELPSGHGLIKAIRIEPGAGLGSRMILELTESARVGQSQVLQASDSAPARIFIDLQSVGRQPGETDEIGAVIGEKPILPA